MAKKKKNESLIRYGDYKNLRGQANGDVLSYSDFKANQERIKAEQLKEQQDLMRRQDLIRMNHEKHDAFLAQQSAIQDRLNVPFTGSPYDVARSLARNQQSGFGTQLTPKQEERVNRLLNIQRPWEKAQAKENALMETANRMGELASKYNKLTKPIRTQAEAQDNMNRFLNDVSAMGKIQQKPQGTNTQGTAQTFQTKTETQKPRKSGVNALVMEDVPDFQPQKKQSGLTVPFNEAQNTDWMAQAKKKKDFNDLMTYLQAGAATGRIADAEQNLGGWMGPLTEQYKEAMRYTNAAGDIEAMEQARKLGLTNGSGDISAMNRKGRNQLRRDLEAENRILKGMRSENLDKLIADYSQIYNMTDEEFERKFGDRYGRWLLDNEISEQDYPIEFFRQNIFEEYQQKLDELQKQKENNQAQIEINEGKLKEIERYNAMDDEYADLMNPASKIAGLQQEIRDLQQEMRYQQQTINGHDQLRNFAAARDARDKYNEMEARLADKQEELARWQRMDSAGGDSEYYEDYYLKDPAPADYIGNSATEARGVMNPSLSRIYSFINEGAEYDYRFGGSKSGQITNEYRGVMTMLPEEKTKFTELYNKAMAEGREPTEAKAFLDALQPYLNQRYRTYEQLRNNMTARNMPISSSLGSVAMTAVAPLQALGTAYGSLTGAQWAEDPNSQHFFNARYQQDVEGQIASDLGPVGGIIYKGAMSGLKNAVRGLESVAFGPAAKVVDLGLFFGENYYNTYQQRLEETGDPKATGVYALVDSAISTLFEVASVEAMFSDSKTLWGAFAKNVLAEASEEFNEGVLGPYIHKVLDGSNEWEEQAKKILDAGGYEDVNGNWVKVDSWRDAWKQACRDWNNNLFESMVVAGLSAGGSTLVSMGNQSLNDNRTGEDILNRNRTKGMNSRELAGLRYDNTINLINAAAAMGENTQSGKAAADMNKDIANGKEISARKVGRLVRLISYESSDEIAKIAQDTLSEQFMKRLKDSGSSQKEAAELSRILVNAVVNNQIAFKDVRTLQQNEEANKILEEYRTSEEKKTFEAQTKAAREAQSSVMEALAAPEDTKKTETMVERSMQGATTAAKADVISAGKSSGSALEVLGGGALADVVSIRRVEEEVEDEENNKKKKKEFRLKVTLSDGRELDIADLKAVQGKTAQVLKFLQNDRGETIGENLANTLVKVTADKKADPVKTVGDAVRMMFAQATGQRNVKTSLDAETESAIRKAITKDLDAAKKDRLSRFREIKPGQSRVVFNGYEYGSSGFNAELNGLDRQTQNEARITASIARSAGVDVEFYYDEKDAGNQGSFVSGTADGGIRVNLAGEYNKEGAHRSAVATFAHETTHWLEANSPDAYESLRDFIFTNLKSAGFDLESELRRVITSYRNHGENLDLNGAISEIVAKGCEQVLTNEELVTKLKEQDPTTYGKVKNAVVKLIGRIRNALGGMRDTSSMYAKALMNVNDELSRLWYGAYEEAKGGSTENDFGRYQTELNGTNGTTQASFIEMQKKTWDDQVTQAFQGEAKKDDVYALTSPEETKGIGINVPISIRQKVFTKGKRISDGTSRSAHDLNESDFRQLKGSVINAPAKIVNNGSVYIVTDQMKDGHPIVLIGKNTNEFAKGGVLDATTVGARNNISTLFGKFVDGKFVPDPGAKIFQYKENAVDLLSLSPGQFGAGPEVYDAISKLTQKEEESKSQKSIQEDEDYEAAVKSGDTATAQRMVDEAAKENGYTEKVYHGTPTGGFTVFKGWSYFTKNKAYADRYQNASASSVRGNYETTNKQTYELYMNPGKVFDTRDPKAAKLYNEARMEYGLGELRNTKTGLPDWTDGRDIIEFIEDRGLDYDTILLDEGADGGYGEEVRDRGISYVTRSNRVKSAEAVTYDDNGNVIPVSERFNEKEQDIRYSFSEESLAELDDQYEEAYNEYDDERGEQLVAEMAERAFPDSKVRDEDGKLKVVYHQTNADPFTVFDMNKARQTEDIVGAFFAPEFDQYHEYGERTYAVYLNITNPAYDEFSFDKSTEGAGLKRRNELIEQGYDGVINTEDGKPFEYIAFYPEQIKSAEAFTEDDDGNLISLSQRMNKWEQDIRYSFNEEEDSENEIRAENGDLLAEVLPGGTITQYSRQSWENEDIEDLTRQLVERGFEKKDVDKWIHDVNGVAKMIADNKELLDYEASPYFTMLKNNQEYVKTLDASTLCAKRLLYQGIFNEIQHLLPNTPIMPEDLIKLVNMMKKKGLVTPCGICYVESRRRMLGKYASEWLKTYEGEYKPKLEEVTTTDGLEKLQSAPEGSAERQAYEDFRDAMNAKGSANPKVVQLRTDYRGEIRKLTDSQIKKVKEIGGLRVQSFSDFETVHLIDMMQAVLDMAAKELTSQAYTKVPAFAWVFGDTGIKINLSLIGEGTGLDENGNLIFSSTEGMDFDEAMKIRDAYSKNVGTILVGMNDAHIIKAMGDDRIDFIIPFHKSGWSKREMAMVSGMSVYKDYTRFQNEKKIAGRKANGKGYQIIPNKKSKITNFGPVSASGKWDGQAGYWDFNKTGIENAETYLRLCAQDQRMPKFANFLVDNGDGSFSLPTDDSERSRNIRKGYWKLLIDFKMYDNEGIGSPQTTVKPNFNMDRAMDVLESYEGGANTLPTDHELAKQFADEYKEEHPGRKQYSFQDEMDMDVRGWMETVNEASLQTEAEKQLLRNFKGVQMRARLKAEQERKIRDEIRGLENVLAGNAENGGARLETMQNALEALGMRIVHTKNGQLLSYNGTVVGRAGGNWIGFTNGVPAGIRDQLEANGFTYNKVTNSWSYTNTNRTTMGETQIRQKLKGLQDRLEKATKEKEAAQDELAKITGSEGYAGMMYRQQRRFNDFQYGKTQAEVRDEIEKLESSAQQIARRIAENQEALGKLEKDAGVQRVRDMLGQTTADRIAGDLKKQYASTWTKGQIRTYLDPILLKMSAGQEFMDDVRQLAEILVNSDSRNTYEELSALRGLTITLGKGAQAELKAQHSSLKEVRARLAGTGITVKYGDRSTLESDIEDLRAEYPNMPDMGDEKNALGNFLDWIDGMKQASASNEFYDQKLAEAIATVTGLSAAAADDIYLPADPRARDQVLELVEYVKALGAETKASQQALADVAAELEKLQAAGRRASGMANSLTHDLNVTIDYYNRMARIAEDTAKQKTRKDIVEQLKSEHAQKIAKNNEEWRNLIERDAKARAQAEDNRSYRGQINTVVKRVYNLLKNPKNDKNVSEHMQGAARMLLDYIIGNDTAGTGLKLSMISKKDLMEARRVLDAWTARDGAPDLSGINDAESEDVTLHIINQDLMAIEEGIRAYNDDIRGKNKLETLQQRGEILRQIQEAASEIYSAIRAEGQVQMNRRKVAVADAAYKVWQKAGGKRFREWTGRAGRALAGMHKAIVSGNMTPEYYFRTLGNEGLSDLWDNYHDAENRNGLELAKAKARMDAIAEEHGYNTWDMQKKYTVELGSGKVEMTLGQLMSLWATWNREQALGPEMSQHLTKGGFYVEQDLRDGMLGRTVVEKKAHRVDEADMARIAGMLTDEQKAYVNDVVQFMSNDMSKLGNEASMAAYGIKLYKEGYYFPFQMWDGIKSRKSNDAAQGANIDRAFHPSFSKSRIHGANNALVIGDFARTAADHIAGMINYATMGLANESLQKVLNYTVEEGNSDLDTTKRNIRAILEETYGQEAVQYLLELQRQLNGGAVRTSKSLSDKAITLFRKNAVAGSLSVALQQPLSYIRAAMMINPKYMTKALMSQYWKESYKERMEHSGVSVIKEMGRFDMNAGQSAREYLMPEKLTSKGRAAWNWATDKATILPELMDRWTWNRMWVAVKAEQHALHPEMDVKSDEFLDMVGERFNELMRRTQVYDSVLVKSPNMRSDHYWVKSLTSFMAEPTLTLNVLADAVRSAKNGEKGGMGMVAKAGATFLLSAALQAAFKGIMSTGRTPDEKKTWWENFLYRFWSNLESEADPLQLIPGFNDLVTILKGGKLEDDAMGAVGKIVTAGRTAVDTILGNGKNGWYRDVEDSAGQLMQLFTNLPAKNIMRDLRAMYNWIVEQPYADRPTSAAVLQNQFAELSMNADNMIGVLNKWLGDAGYKADSAAYKKRVYEAMRDGNEEAAQGFIDYLLNGKGAKSEKGIMTGTGGVTSYVVDDYKAGNITRDKAEELLQKANPAMDSQSMAKKLDEVDYEARTGEEVESYSLYMPLYDAMDQGDEEEIEAQKKHLTEVGVKESTITSQMKSHIKDQYRDGEINRKQAEELYRKYAPGMKPQDIAKALDEIDYENETGEDVDSYSLYTRIFEAVDKGDAATIKSQKSYLKSIGIEEKDVNSQIASHISSEYKDGNLKRADAERMLKSDAGKDADEAFWTLDRIDYKKSTGKDASGTYYRLWDAMDNNSANEIRSAVQTMTKHGVEAKNIKSQISSHYKKAYLAADSSGKRRIRDAIQKTYKTLGFTAEDADKIINKWK